MCAFVPQELDWTADRAVLLVHGIGNASAGDTAFPVAELEQVLGASAGTLAVYTLNYDFINDWTSRKLQLGAGVSALGAAISSRFGNGDLADKLAEYGGDVLWPILHQDTRLAIRDALLAQLQQIVLDRGRAARARRQDPLTYRITIIAHSLGCFHVYEALHAAAREPSYRLRPNSDQTRFANVILMASPVQLIRSVAGDIGALVPAPDELATLARSGLAIPAESAGKRKKIPATTSFISVTGTQDPVGGHLLGDRQTWAYMDVPGQQSEVVAQSLVGGDLKTALGSGGGIGAAIQDPHSWSAYITAKSAMLASVLA